MTILAWDAVTTQCDGLLETSLAAYEVLASFEASVLDPIGQTQELSFEIPLTPAPGQVLYMRVRAWDLAGNSSDSCMGEC